MLGMLGDRKKAVSVILGESPSAEEKKVSNGLEADFSSAYEQMAKDILSSVEGKDHKMLASALKSMVQAMMREDEYKEEPEEMEG